MKNSKKKIVIYVAAFFFTCSITYIVIKKEIPATVKSNLEEIISVKYSNWSKWSDWSATPVTADDLTQVDMKKETITIVNSEKINVPFLNDGIYSCDEEAIYENQNIIVDFYRYRTRTILNENKTSNNYSIEYSKTR